MSTTSTALIYAELLSNIRQISVIAALPTPSNSQTKARLLDDAELLELWHDGKSTALRLPGQIASSYTLAPPKPGLQEISWRMPLANQASMRPSIADIPDVPWSARELSTSSELSCRNCNAILLPAGRVSVWRDLPSENWAEMMDFWHCHKPTVKTNGTTQDDEHLLSKGYGANTKFVAQSGVGKVDLTYFLLSNDDCTGLDVRNLSCYIVIFLTLLNGYQEGGLVSRLTTCPQWHGHRYKYPITSPNRPTDRIAYPLSRARVTFLSGGFNLCISSISSSRCWKFVGFALRNIIPPISTYLIYELLCILGINNSQVREFPTSQTSTSSLNPPIACASCKRIVGNYDLSASGPRLFKWSLTLATPSSPSTSPCSPPLPHILLPYLQALTASRAVSKFILRAPAVPEPGVPNPSCPNLYIWLFAPNLTVSFSGKDDALPMPMHASKLFYTLVEDLAVGPLVDAANAAVDEILLPAHIVHELLEMLRCSSKKLPASVRKFGTWDVGILERGC
jgi:hypothetical protein